MSELYGVTSWDFDFRGYKLAGDWQAAMGVTVRVPHLAWVSMEGEAKRDYPAAIGYQSPWYRKFGAVEDHFSRLNTALTRGKPIVRVGVIHPIESYWLHWGPREQSELAAQELESNFANINKWLSFGGIDFDYISETTLPSLCKKGGSPLQVGKMAYDAVVVPACETLRKTTLERLEAFRRAGGKLIFMGNAPTLMDAIPSEEPKRLYDSSMTIPFSRSELLSALEEIREIELRAGDGAYATDMLYQMRQDGNDRWVFVCHAVDPYNKHISKRSTLRIKLRGAWSVRLYDTQSGNIRPQTATIRSGATYISLETYDYDSFLFRLSPVGETAELSVPAPAVIGRTPIETASLVPFTTGEPNALLLDMAEYALDDEPYRAREELLRADTICRKRLGWPTLSGGAAQPWCIEQEPITHHIKLRFHINSTLRLYGASLAIEHPERANIVWNGQSLPTKSRGYYVDRSIKTVRIPVVNKGENILEVTLPFGKRTATEWCYLLGHFGTRVVGSEAVIVPMAERLGYGNIVPQTLSFYSGTLDYHLDIAVPASCDGDELVVRVPQYKGTLVDVLLDGRESGEIIYPPYELSLGNVSCGEHRVTLRLYVPRTNGFGPVHLADERRRWHGPDIWRTDGDNFGYEYHLLEEGILMKPEILCVKRES